MLKEFQLQHDLRRITTQCGVQIAAAPRPDWCGENQTGKTIAQGAYVVADAVGGPPHVTLIGTGSELQLAIKARESLAPLNIRARVVSMPSHELFAAQEQRYRDEVLLPGVPRVAVEAAHPMSWHRWVGERGAIVGIDHFGASAPYERIYEEFGVTAERVVEAARAVVQRL